MKPRAAVLLALGALLLAAGPALAIKAMGDTRRDSKRFGKALGPGGKPGRSQERAAKAFSGFNRANGGRWKMRFNPRTGAPEALVEGTARPRGLAPAAAGGGGSAPPLQAAGAFLSEERELLSIDPATLVVERQSHGQGHDHVLYRQTYKGLPVEFSRLKVHMSAEGSVIGAHSRYEADLALETNPSVSAPQAADVVLRDGGIPPTGDGALVVFPGQLGDKARLAWKFTARGKTSIWRYYVDAHDGRLLFRYNDMRAVCLTSGTVSAMLWEIDPTTSPLVSRPINNQKVWVRDSSTYAVTGVDPFYGGGFFCSGTTGKIFTSLQGPKVNVASFIGRSAHYDNGSGVWTTIATPVSSPHPYANGSVHTSTVDISIPAPLAVKILPVFSSFQVGSVEAGNDITDDDQLEILGEDDRPIAAYLGGRTQFNGAAVSGRRMRLRLRSNAAGQRNGYDVALSSYLTLSVPTAVAAGGSSLTWSGAHTAFGKHGEITLFYQLNKMHDYFMRDINKSSAAYIGQSVLASAYVGPSISGAFYNPEFDNLNFGDIDSGDPQDILMDDGTVPRHEFAHYVVEKIWSIQNFGQAGAISEAIADYFSASSLDYSSIGRHYSITQGGTEPLRQLDCQSSGPCRVLGVNQAWAGDIHDDSIFLSQALWDIRRGRIIALGHAAGQSCADGLVFQSLLYFPESFSEFLDALRRVDSAGAVASCGGANTVQAAINLAFANHGLVAAGADAFEGARGNDGFESAVDITTYTSLSASISPASDLDFFSFAAGPGPLQLTLRLPADGRPGLYKGYGMKLFDRSHRLIAEGNPPFDGQDTFADRCEAYDCTTSQSAAVLSLNNSTPGLLFLQIGGGATVEGASNSGVNSTALYQLETAYTRPAALTGGVVAAVFDNDRLSFTVNVTTFVRTQNYNFARAQLRDHTMAILPNTETGTLGSYLTMISSANGLGKVSGVLQLNAGFAARFPSVGTVHLEVFGYNVDPDNIRVSTISLGLSQAMNLTADKADLKLFNNVFNPLRGGKTTVKYDLLLPGHLTLKLYTMGGALVKTLFDGDATAGKGSLDWNGTNLGGSVVASGIYILQLDAPGISKRQKIVVVK